MVISIFAHFWPWLLLQWKMAFDKPASKFRCLCAKNYQNIPDGFCVMAIRAE